MTRRLYDENIHIREFSARVCVCVPRDDAWEVILDRTAFFPGGGGQEPDTGTVGGFAAAGWGERDGEILHRVTSPLAPGETVECAIDWAPRFSRMQQHSGEHLLSGILHALCGAENTGFHMGREDVVVDFDRYIPPEQLRDAEARVNRAIWENVPVTVSYPDPEALPALTYRSKLDLRENVRLVTIEGYDVCACCAPHVLRTGEIGLIKILESARRKEGTRLHMLAGSRALDLLNRYADEAREVSGLLSVPPEAIGSGMRWYAEAHRQLEYRYGALRRRELAERLEKLEPCEGNLVLIEDGLDAAALREAVNRGVELCTGLCAAFSGSDETGYRYVIGAAAGEVSSAAGEINRAIQGRGGGRGARIEGSAAADEAAIRAFFKTFSINE